MKGEGQYNQLGDDYYSKEWHVLTNELGEFHIKGKLDFPVWNLSVRSWSNDYSLYGSKGRVVWLQDLSRWIIHGGKMAETSVAKDVLFPPTTEKVIIVMQEQDAKQKERWQKSFRMGLLP